MYFYKRFKNKNKTQDVWLGVCLKMQRDNSIGTHANIARKYDYFQKWIYLIFPEIYILHHVAATG